MMRKIRRLKKLRKQYFIVITKQGTAKIDMDDILYFEKDLRKVNVHTTDGIYSYYGSFKDLHGILDYRFCRCHYSIIVNLSKIISLERYIAYLEGGETITVSQRKYPYTRIQYLTFLI